MSAGSTRRAHRNWRRNERRLQAYLHRCVICFGEDRTSPYPSSLLPCCHQFCHEHCLLRWLECSHTPGPVKSCPHCRAALLPVRPQKVAGNELIPALGTEVPSYNCYSAIVFHPRFLHNGMLFHRIVLVYSSFMLSLDLAL